MAHINWVRTKKGHLFTRILSLFLLISIIPAGAINYIWYSKMEEEMIKTAENNTDQLLTQSAAAIKQNIIAINTAILSIALDQDIVSILTTTSLTDEIDPEKKEVIASKLTLAKTLNDSIASITLISRNMTYAVSTSGKRTNYDLLFSQSWYKYFVTSGVSTFYTGIHLCPYIENIRSNTFTILYRINPDSTGFHVAFLILEVYASMPIYTINSICSTGTSLQILDRDNNLCYSYSKSFVPTDDNVVIKQKKIDILDWTIEMTIQKDALQSDVETVRQYFSYILLFVILCVAILAIVFTSHITRPIARLSDATHKVRTGDLTVQLPITTNDEIGRASDDFNAMIIKIRELINDVKNKEQERFNAEIRALQAQINPHFLYNTLNVIRWLSMMKENEKIDELVVALVHLLEYTKEDMSDFVPIQREVEHTRRYIQVMSIRYADKFDYVEKIDPGVLSFSTIRFVLQPLIENAIFHGIDPANRKGTITLEIKIERNSILFSVSDNGIGLDLEKNRHRFFSGYGISNVNDRLRMQFGNESMLQVNSEVGKGLTVSFTIPITPGSEEE